MMPSPTQSNVLAALKAFMVAVLPGLPGSQPAVFKGSIAGTTLAVAQLPGLQPAGIVGQVQLNAPLLGLGVAPGTTILSQISGTPGGVGTYEVSISQGLATPATMSTGVSVVTGQINRVAEPNNPYFVVMWPLRDVRLATNLDEDADVKIAASIAGSLMTVTAVEIGSLSVGAVLFGNGAVPGTRVTGLGTGSGGSGTYSVAPAQNLASGTMSAGSRTLTENTEVAIQVDLHAPDSQAVDFARTVSTTIRDEFGTSFFAALPAPLNGVSPLYADDPQQAPFLNAEQQYEWRETLEVHLQFNPSVSVPAQYADVVGIVVESVDATFPP